MGKYTIDTFLLTKTPEQWIEKALDNIPLLLVDHAHCEKKAAATAIGMIYRYSDKKLLLEKMSKLAREELGHFEQVLALIERRGEKFYHLSPSLYAATLHSSVTNHEPNKLVDSLILGAFIEARSCERFARLAEVLPAEIGSFYQKLFIAEARHFSTYLELAQTFSNTSLEKRIAFFAELEADLIMKPDDVFRFHSGNPLIGDLEERTV